MDMDSVGLRATVLGRSYYPLKPHVCVSFGRSPSFVKTCSQVFTTKLVNPLFLLVFDAFILSSVSPEFITLSHLDLISWLLWVFSWITLSQHSTHIRKADSERRIRRRRDAPLRRALLAHRHWTSACVIGHA